MVELEAVKEQQGLEDVRRSSSSFARVFEALQQVRARFISDMGLYGPQNVSLGPTWILRFSYI